MSADNDIITDYRKLSSGKYILTTTHDCLYDKMSITMDIDFAEWLIIELNKRGWSQSDLARAAGINRQVISAYINRQRKKPDTDKLKAIAKAFNLPAEVVFDAANVLHPENADNEEKLILLHHFENMTDEKRKILLSIAEKFSEEDKQKVRNKKEPGKTPGSNAIKRAIEH